MLASLSENGNPKPEQRQGPEFTLDHEELTVWADCEVFVIMNAAG
jgi:hypothetical protein